MQIELSGHHVEITDALREAVDQKLAKIASHYPQIDSCNVILTVEKNDQKTEINTHFMGADFSAEASHADMYSSIADAVKKLDSTLSHKKGAAKAQRHKGPSLSEMTG